MLIAVAGPYSAPTKEERQQNLDRMNEAAAKVFEKGHVPVIGMNAALPVLAHVHFENEQDRYNAIMKISLAVVAPCQGILIVGKESPGVLREKGLMIGEGHPVWTHIDQVPDN